MFQSRPRVRQPLAIATLATACWWWAPGARAQCPQRWRYEAARTTPYLSPLFVSDSGGDLFWWEYTDPGTIELVAVRDGVTRWRRRLTTWKVGPFLMSASLVRDDLLAVAFASTIEGLRTRDGATVWSRDLRADLASDLRKAGLPQPPAVRATFTARLGRVLVATVETGTSTWLAATALDGRSLWRSRLAGSALQLLADGDRLYVLLAQPTSNPSVVAVDRRGSVSAPTPYIAEPAPGMPFDLHAALSGGDVVFDRERLVRMGVAASGGGRCPPNSPSCRPPTFRPIVTGYTAGGHERWHLSPPAGGEMRGPLLLLSDGSVLLVGNEHVARIAPDGHLTPLCNLPADVKGSVAALINGDLVVAYFHDVRAYTLPDAPTLAATGWVMHGGSPAQDWAVRRAPADGRAPAAVPAAPFVPFPAGVADPTADVAYVQGDSGFAMALALGDGTERWRTHRPTRPVGIWNGELIVLEPDAGELRVLTSIRRAAPSWRGSSPSRSPIEAPSGLPRGGVSPSRSACGSRGTELRSRGSSPSTAGPGA